MIQRNDLARAAVHALWASAAFALMGACIKAVSAQTSTEVVVFFRNAVSLLLLLPLMWRSGLRNTVRTDKPGGHLLRTGFGMAAMYCFFYAIGHLPLAAAVLLTYSTPLWVPFIAWLWLRERPDPIVFPSVLLGLAGIALIVKPGSGAFGGMAVIVGLAAGVLAGFAMVSIRRISDTEPPERIVFYLAAVGTLISLPPLYWAWQTPDARTLVLLVGTGAFATLGQLQLTRAYGCAPAARVGPFGYSAVMFSALLAWVLWGESLDRWALLGMLVVIASCILAGWRRREPQMEE
ncbi:DMT family transporter [Panacagrimonas sp.]|uniref:DMT family transporter n=1 Tax=Panacagrimonas sp. TaxID=2480088 RepID=UPI003B5185BB